MAYPSRSDVVYNPNYYNHIIQCCNENYEFHPPQKSKTQKKIARKYFFN